MVRVAELKKLPITALLSKVMAWLDKQPKDALFTNEEVAKACRTTMASLSSNCRPERCPGLKKYIIVVRNKRYWGNPSATNSLRKELAQ